MMSRFLSGALGICLALVAGNSWGAAILTWSTTGNLGTETMEPSAFNSPGIQSADLTLGDGISVAGAANRFGGRGWSIALNDSIANDDYIQFIVAPEGGFVFSVDSFAFSWHRSTTGPTSVALRSSLDSFASNIGQVTGITEGSNALRNIAVSGLNDISTATTFRLYGFGGTNAATGTGGFNTSNATSPNVVLSGSVTAVPEPSSLALLTVCGVAGVIYRRRRAGSQVAGADDVSPGQA